MTTPKVETSSHSTTMLLLRKDVQGWARNRASRTTFDLSDEERQELWECFQAVTEDGLGGHLSELTWKGLTKAADVVLGAGKYDVHSLKQALTEMDLNHNGTISWPEWRSYMSSNWSASKDADRIINQQEQEDMITIEVLDGTNMRLVDMVKHYRRRVIMQKLLKGDLSTFTQLGAADYENGPMALGRISRQPSMARSGTLSQGVSRNVSRSKLTNDDGDEVLKLSRSMSRGAGTSRRSHAAPNDDDDDDDVLKLSRGSRRRVSYAQHGDNEGSDNDDDPLGMNMLANDSPDVDDGLSLYERFRPAGSVILDLIPTASSSEQLPQPFPRHRAVKAVASRSSLKYPSAPNSPCPPQPRNFRNSQSRVSLADGDPDIETSANGSTEGVNSPTVGKRLGRGAGGTSNGILRSKVSRKNSAEDGTGFVNQVSSPMRTRHQDPDGNMRSTQSALLPQISRDEKDLCTPSPMPAAAVRMTVPDPLSNVTKSVMSSSTPASPSYSAVSALNGGYQPAGLTLASLSAAEWRGAPSPSHSTPTQGVRLPQIEATKMEGIGKTVNSFFNKLTGGVTSLFSRSTPSPLPPPLDAPRSPLPAAIRKPQLPGLLSGGGDNGGQGKLQSVKSNKDTSVHHGTVQRAVPDFSVHGGNRSVRGGSLGGPSLKSGSTGGPQGGSSVFGGQGGRIRASNF